MATSLLRLGRLGSVKGVLREGWGTPRTSLIAALCSKTDVPPKTTKKAKASSKSKTDERASLLAYKPAVAFPSKLSATGFLPKDVALGEAEAIEAVSMAAASETTAGGPVADTAAAEEAKIPEVPPTNEVTTKSEGSQASDVESEVQKDQDDSSSSSSSSSDSDSDSDSDDEKPKTETPETLQSGEKTAEEKKAPAPTTESASYGEAKESAKTVTKAKPGEVPASSAKPDGSDETLIDPAPIVSSSTTESTPEMSSQYIKAETTEKTLDTATEVKTALMGEIAVEKEPEIKAEDAVKVAPEVVIEASPEEVVECAVEASPGVGPEASGDVAAEDTSSRAEAGTPAAPSEELLDPAPVSADAVEVRAETDVVETPEEQAPEKAPEPEPEPEPFDNTTYKNLQHHDYNMYTFADMDLEMSKHRQPQPSSGRR